MVKTRAANYGNDDESEGASNTPTPTLSPNFSTNSPIRTMPAKNTSNESEIPEWKTINFRSKIMTIVKNSGKQLKKDGSNYRDWNFCIRDLIDDWIEPGWLDCDDAHLADPKGDRIVLMVIKSSIETDIAMKISKAPSAADATKTIKALFYFPSRSKQVACLHNMLAVCLDNDEDVDTYLRSIAEGFDELDQDGFVFTKDSLMSIFYELALPAKYSDVTSTLNGVLRVKPTDPITANQTPGSNMRPSQGNLRPQFRITGRTNSSPAHVDKCRACGTNGHWAWACPHNLKNMDRSEQADTWRSQPQRGPRASTSTNNASERSIKVNFVDINGNPFEAEIEGLLPEGVWMSKGNLEASDDTDNIGDTGALHNVTGDVSRLIHFRKLKRPIPLFVATETPTAYITGWGTLMYQSDDGSPLLLDDRREGRGKRKGRT
ncbi:hypothetical protein CROQUDRAFT_101033 [Cronartium quercuum f. sp. fusiforme G11]|uniref:CCHC-type domain-containing protein n=1 Tax=Cronartium quercuum f. sp. fusiforme G11 TaxID=708437 RepID=A0A9P6N685_9BASI|nr:hypothetical protein CROQUDRAFT_101033 [Cronartium quercuum f. sp. fusiforme G11]